MTPHDIVTLVTTLTSAYLSLRWDTMGSMSVVRVNISDEERMDWIVPHYSALGAFHRSSLNNSDRVNAILQSSW